MSQTDQLHEDVHAMELLIEKNLLEYQQALANKSKDTIAKQKALDKNIGIYTGMIQIHNLSEKNNVLQDYKRRKNETRTMGVSVQKQVYLGAIEKQKQIVDEKMDRIISQLEKGQQLGNEVLLKLNQQMEDLDAIYEENQKAGVHLKRINKHLTTLLRNIMKDKITRGLAVLLLLGIIALIIVKITKK